MPKRTAKQLRAAARRAKARGVIETLVQKTLRWGHRLAKEKGQLSWIAEPKEGLLERVTLVLRPDTERLLFYVDLALPEATAANVVERARFAHRANWGTTDGNFEVDVRTGAMRYKVALDYSGIALPPVLVRNVVLNALDAIEYFGPAVAEVASGRSTADAVFA